MKRIAVAALTVAVSAAGLTCGGTTGREDLPATMSADDGGATPADGAGDATVSDSGADAFESGDATLSDAGSDATLADDSESNGAFDVEILYADRILPDVVGPVTASEGGGQPAYPWPNCPPFVPVIHGKPVQPGTETDQVRAAYDDAGQVLLDDAGRVVPLPDGSACADYGWLGSPAVDECMTSQNEAILPVAPFLLPPCNWCVEAGTAMQGPRAADPRYDICLDLYACMKRTGCGLSAEGWNLPACLCGDASTVACTAAQGPCGKEELAALEYASDPASVQNAANHFYSISSSSAAFCGAVLNRVFQDALTASPVKAQPGQINCFPADAGPF